MEEAAVRLHLRLGPDGLKNGKLLRRLLCLGNLELRRCILHAESSLLRRWIYLGLFLLFIP